MPDKEAIIAYVRNNIGWAYPDFKWATGKLAEDLNRERNALLDSLLKKTKASFLRNKIHIGELSPGCKSCGEGYWSCMYINHRCTENCFFCPQDRKCKDERLPTVEVSLDDPDNYIAYIERFNYRGISFSGGEPFLVFEKLVNFIEKIRKKFGRSKYIWVYTNGDLVTQDKLQRLKKAGLDELRFNITQTGYDLGKVRMAVGTIKTVTIEIPMIPEEYDIVKQLLPDIKKAGVKHLHLHQLMASQFNYKNFISRNYTYAHSLPASVVESEIAALKILEYAADAKIGLPINYCSRSYKEKFQSKAARDRYASSVQMDFEGLTAAKYIRTLSIKDTPARISKLAALMKKKSRPELWAVHDNKSEIFFHHSLLKLIDFNRHRLIITYYEPQFSAGPLGAGELGARVQITAGLTVHIRKAFKVQQVIGNLYTAKMFERLFIKREDWHSSIASFYKQYPLKSAADAEVLNNEVSVLATLKGYEEVEMGPLEIF